LTAVQFAREMQTNVQRIFYPLLFITQKIAIIFLQNKKEANASFNHS